MLNVLLMTGALLAQDTAGLPTSYRRAIDVESVRDKEGPRIAAHPGLVRRSGKTLIVSYNGKAVFTDKDTNCDDGDDCHANYFLGTVDLYSPRSGKIETYAQIARMYWEGIGFFIIGDDGNLFAVSGEAVGSPDGRTVASGEDFVDGYADGSRLTISRWDAKAQPVAFAPSCRPNQWNGNRELTALCEHWGDGGVTAFEGLARQDAAGQWTLKVVRVLFYEPNTGLPPERIDGQVFKAEPVSDHTP